jgi:hypothetical protein
VVFQLLFGRFRGLIPYAPVLVLAAAGYFRMRQHRAERNLCIGITVYYILFVSSYEWWHGGSSFGSRHLAPMLPFLVLPLAMVVGRRPRLVAAASAVSIAFMTIVTAVQPKPSERLADPFYQGIWPAFRGGIVAANNICADTGRPDHNGFALFRPPPRDAFNWGMYFGLRGPTSLWPLVVFWAGAAGVVWRIDRHARVCVDPGPHAHRDRAPALTPVMASRRSDRLEPPDHTPEKEHPAGGPRNNGQ